MQNTKTNLQQFKAIFTWANANHIPEATLPRDIAQLSIMNSLNLHNLGLTTIPSEIGLLSNLKALYISSNELTSLPKELGKLIHLETLWIQNNRLTSLPDELADLHNLKELVAFGNELTSIPAEVLNMPELKLLFLHNNYLDQTDPIYKSVPDTLQVTLYKQKKRINERFHIEVLEADRLDSATVLRDSIFKSMTIEEALSLKAYVYKAEYEDWYSESGITALYSWVLVETAADKVVGLTGLYTEEDDDEETCWLGWFCVDPNYRKRGLGQALLSLSISEAKRMEKVRLKLYTYNSEEFWDAIKLYQSFGFRVLDTGRKKARRKDLVFMLEF
jgi:ribosomal protein S18 acetylase RimI-like enzyme